MKKFLVVGVCLFFLSASTVLAQDFCKGDFNYNGSVAAEDVEVFLQHFGRNPFNNPCPTDGPAPVPKTGQTSSWITGDDGSSEKGVAWPNPRFTDNSDGTVTDNLTGLIWLKNANCFGYRTWGGALFDCNGLSTGSCGLTDGSGARDWRLPNSNELASLVSRNFYSPALSNTAGTGQWSQGDPFNNVQSFYYWSSTFSVYGAGSIWTVSMDTGAVWITYVSDASYVWPVRGGEGDQPIYRIDDIPGDSGKNFPMPQEITLNMGSTACVDIYLADAYENQNSGGVWLDFTSSTADISYVSAGRALLDGSEGVTGPWSPASGYVLNEPDGLGTLMMTVSFYGVPDTDGDIIVGQVCLRHDSTNDASINIITVPYLATWAPINDRDIIPGSFIIRQ